MTLMALLKKNNYKSSNNSSRERLNKMKKGKGIDLELIGKSINRPNKKLNKTRKRLLLHKVQSQRQ